MADNDALEVVRNRFNFYRDNYRRVVGALLLMIVVNMALVGVAAYQVTHVPPPRYFATSADGRITPLYPLSAPMVSDSELRQWAVRATVDAFSYDFANYKKELQDASENFTSDGWSYFMSSLERSRNLETVLAKKLAVQAVATGAPIITQQGVINNVYAWQVELPLLVTYQSLSEHFQQTLIIHLIVTRVPTLNMPRGYAIASFYASEQPLSQGRTT